MALAVLFLGFGAAFVSGGAAAAHNGVTLTTVFTTHATVIGRCLAGHNLPLYSKDAEYDADARAAEFGVTARHSLEKTSARNADIFTTVSAITAGECTRFLGRTPGVLRYRERRGEIRR